MSILNLSFDYSTSLLFCCTELGYIIYSLLPNLEKKLFRQLNGGIGIMRMFKKTNLFLLVGGGDRPARSKDIIILWDDNKQRNIVEIDLREPVKNTFINNSRIIAVLEKKVCIFDFSGILIDEKITYFNENGLSDMSTSIDESKNEVVLAILGTEKGNVAIWKISLDSNKNGNFDDYMDISAHNSNIEALALSKDGKLLATASEVGTLIRIFDTGNGKLCFEFRRGTTQTSISGLCFNDDLSVLACCSGNGTIHFFDLYKNMDDNKNTQSFFVGFKNYLPSFFGSQWSFKQLNLGVNKAVLNFDNSGNLHVCSFDGSYYKISGRDGGYYNTSQGQLCINNK